jgi:hypothetical protein
MNFNGLFTFYNHEIDTIINKVLDESLVPSIKTETDSRFGLHHYYNAFELIPHDTKDKELLQYSSQLLKYTLENIGSEGQWNHEKIPFQLIQEYQPRLAKLLLFQNNLTLFSELVDWSFINSGSYSRRRDSKFMIIANSLEQMTALVEETNELLPVFWSFWEYLFSKEKEANTQIFGGILLFDFDSWRTSQYEPLLAGKKQQIQEAIGKYQSIRRTLKLIAGIGFTECMPDGIIWIKGLLQNKPLSETDDINYAEKLVISIFYNNTLRTTIKTNRRFQDPFMQLLDQLINTGSASAFLIREDIISTK